MTTGPAAPHDLPAWEDTPVRTLVAGVWDTALERLREAGDVELVDDPTQAAACDLAVVSSRLPRVELGETLQLLKVETTAPIVALVHTGGEAAAIEVLRAGGVGVVAEGNEAAVLSYLDNTAYDESMVETYDHQAGQRGRSDPLRGRDRVTHLPGLAAFEQRVDELVHAGDIPRVGFCRVLHLAEVADRLSREAAALLRRRLSVSYRQLCHRHGVELYAINDTDFALVGPNLSANRAEQLGHQMAGVTETYTPMGNRSLALALGHAGPEASLDLAPLQEIARRALEVAAIEKQSFVVSAEKLALGVSSTTELETAQRAVAYIEQHGPHASGHGQRTAERAAEIAWHLGLEGQSRIKIQLAGLLHDVGKIGLPTACLAGPRGLDAEQTVLYETHPGRSAEWLRPSAGDDVADIVRHHHERWDGTGYPDGLAGELIPIGSRIVRIADALDGLLAGADPEIDAALPPAEALAVLTARAGTELDPDLTETAVPVLDKLLSGRDA